MNHFERRDGELFAEGVALRTIADEVGTPTYIYSAATLTRHFTVFDAAWGDIDHTVCYAVKALSNLSVLALLARLGAGFDIVSSGELRRVLAAGGVPSKVVFSGVGKTRDEMREALSVGIKCFNVESEAELHELSEVATELGAVAPVSLRVNPDVDPKTHPYIATGLRESKFGVPWQRAPALYAKAAALPGLKVVGVDCHIGSQLSELAPVLAAMAKLLELVDQLTADGHRIQHLDIGGGLGITYQDETPPTPAAYAKAVMGALGDRQLEIVTEPGRVIAGNAGVLLMRCIRTKDNGEREFVVVDAGMNDAIRPALYGAWHTLEAVVVAPEPPRRVDVVGPVCESGDFFAKQRDLPPIVAGDLLVMRSAGAYGFVMASQYNSRPRPAEVLVNGDRYDVVRRRESYEDLVRGEIIVETPEA